MPVKLTSLRDMPDDEIEEIHELLTQHRIDYYETPAGNWGISAPAIWLHQPKELEGAKELLEQYQEERGQRMQAEHEQLRQQGLQRTLIDQIREYPLRVIALLALAVAVAYFSVVPFIEIGQVTVQNDD